jgi:hypothetical protein
MKKLIGIAVVFALLSFVGSAYGAVAISDKVEDTETYVGEATSICVEGQDVAFDGSKVTILANGHKDGVTANVSTESSLTSAALAYGFIRKVTADGTAAQNRVGLANGTAGQLLTIQLTTKGTNSWVITKDSGTTSCTTTGWSTLTFDTSLDSITLWYIDDTYGWVVMGNNGVTVA